MENHATSAGMALRPWSAAQDPKPRGPEQLATLHLTCEASGNPFDYEVPSDAGTLKDLWDRHLMVSCPHCQKVHSFLFRSAYVEAMLARPGLSLDRLET
jgi:hypothetical protein